MSLNKRLTVVFLSVINIMNILAGIITQVKIITGSDVTSIIPIKAEMTVNQILLVNFMSVAVIMLLICIVTTYLVTDVAYTPLEILSSCPFVFMIIPLVIFGMGVFNAFNAEFISDKIWIAVCSVIYLFANAVNIGCLITVKEDAQE